MTPEEELAYWRALAVERGRTLDAMRERIRCALDLLPAEHVALLSAALDDRLTGWMCEPDRMEPLGELRSSDVATVMDELWKRLAADGGR